MTVRRRRTRSDDGAAALPADVPALHRLIRKQEHDFATILEVATRINARVLDDHRIESYLQSLAGYVTTLARGQFGVSKAYLFRQPDLDTPALILPPARDGDGAALTFELDGGFGRLLQRQRGAFRLAEIPSGAGAGPELGVLAEMGVALCVPLRTPHPFEATDLKGLLCLGPKLIGGPFTASELRFIGLLSDMAAVALRNAHLHRKSIVDDLTRLYSRGHFDMHLSAEIARADRYGQRDGTPRPVSLILMDIDHFKRFNDAHGHPAGDRVLRAAADALQKSIRRSDVAARYGGEEFALIAVETSREEAARLAERLRARVAETAVVLGGAPRSVTASLGVAAFPADARTPQELVARADEALYRAKASGRNRVFVTGGG